MSETDTNKKQNERDAMDGGFAVVDRERLIEEETKEVTPWYKLFIRAFTSPVQMMEECFQSVPGRGGSVGTVGCILFTVINMLISFINPVTKLKTMDQLRASGVTEDAIDQVYGISIISGIIVGIIMVFLSCLITAVLIQIIKAVLKDKGTFANLYKMLLIVSMVSMAVTCVDSVLAYFLGMSGSIFSVSILLSDGMKTTALWSTLGSFLSLSNILCIALMIAGYKVITGTSYKRGLLVILITEAVSFGVQYAYVDWAFKMQASVLGA